MKYLSFWIIVKTTENIITLRFAICSNSSVFATKRVESFVVNKRCYCWTCIADLNTLEMPKILWNTTWHLPEFPACKAVMTSLEYGNSNVSCERGSAYSCALMRRSSDYLLQNAFNAIVYIERRVIYISYAVARHSMCYIVNAHLPLFAMTTLQSIGLQRIRRWIGIEQLNKHQRIRLFAVSPDIVFGLVLPAAHIRLGMFSV